MIQEIENFKKYDLIDPPRDCDYSERFEILKKQILGFLEENNNQYPIILRPSNSSWLYVRGIDGVEVELKNYFDIEYFLIQYLQCYLVETNKDGDRAHKYLYITRIAGGMYEEDCHRKETLPFKEFHDIFEDNWYRLLELIR